MNLLGPTHLIFGASGFLGTHLCRHLLSCRMKVTGVDILPHQIASSDLFNFHLQDYKDLSLLRFETNAVIHHCASLVPLGAQGFDEKNVDSLERFIENLPELRPSHFIYYSSSSVSFRADSNEFPIRPEEESPIEKYGASKLAAEKRILKACRELGIPLTILRPRTILGPGRLGLFELLFSQISRNKTVILPGDPAIPYHFIHVDDLLSAVDVILENSAVGTFNIASEVSSSLLSDLESLVSHAKSSTSLLWLPQGFLTIVDFFGRFGLIPFARWQYLAFSHPHILDTSDLKKLGWRPRKSSLLSLVESYDWFISHSLHQDSLRSLHSSKMRLGAWSFLR